MKILKILSFLKILALLLALLIILPSIARAEGPLSGGTRLYIEDEPLGPFTVSSFAAPNPPVTSDGLWVTVQVRDGGKAVTDAQVWVTVLARKQDVVQRMEAVHELAAAPFDYTARLDVPEADTYEVLIQMKHERGEGETRYTVNVSEPMTNFILILMAGPALLIAIALIHRFVIRMPNSVAVLAGDDEPLAEERT